MELLEISKDLGLRGWSVLNKDDIVTQLSRKRSISLDEIPDE
jgi:hypothetical protein